MTEKDDAMVNNLAPARARESAEEWLADRKLALPTPPRVSAAWAEQAMADAFAAGFGQAGEAFADERQIGQRQLDDARSLMIETALLLRGYEAHHLERAGAYREEADQAHGHRRDAARDDQRASLAKAERNALAAARLEAWLAGEERYPTNPAEALRQIAERAVDGETIKGVDHPSFDAAAEAMERPVTIYRLGEAHDLVSAMDGAALIEEGVGWVKVHGVRDAHALFNVLRLAKIAAEAGEPDEENPEASADWFERARLIAPGEDSVVAHGERLAPWRLEGVADLAAFRLTTGDPGFDPARPVTINGFLYHPTKED